VSARATSKELNLRCVNCDPDTTISQRWNLAYLGGGSYPWWWLLSTLAERAMSIKGRHKCSIRPVANPFWTSLHGRLKEHSLSEGLSPDGGPSISSDSGSPLAGQKLCLTLAYLGSSAMRAFEVGVRERQADLR
jgi:hypothetical protein